MAKTNRQCITYRPKERIPKLNTIMYYMGYDVLQAEGRKHRIPMSPEEVFDKLIDMGYTEILRQIKAQEKTTKQSQDDTKENSKKLK